MSILPNDNTPEEWKRQKELYCSFKTMYIPEKLMYCSAVMMPIPERVSFPLLCGSTQSECNMVFQIEDEKCLDFVFCLIESLKNNDNSPSFPGGLHINPHITSMAKPQLPTNLIIYLRGTSNLYLPLLTDEKSKSIFSIIPKDIEFFNNALGNIKMEFPQRIHNDTLDSLRQLGFLTYPSGNNKFIYLFLPASYSFQYNEKLNQDNANIGSLYALFQYWVSHFPSTIYPGPFTTYPAIGRAYLVLDNFDLIENHLEGIKNLIDDVKQLNRLGVSVIIITRDNRLKSEPYCEGVFPLYLDIKASHRGKEQINVNLVRSPFAPQNSYRFFKGNGRWKEYHEKYKQYYPQIREAFTRYGMTAAQIKEYLKDYFQIDISLAALSKLLLKLGLRRNKYHKRKRTKGKR